MEFYKKCFGAELYLMPFSEMPGNLPKQAQQAKDRIMHASLTKGFRLKRSAEPCSVGRVVTKQWQSFHGRRRSQYNVVTST
jgi:uncharacterized glyoxalase superfamily protein PhnB